MNSISLNFKTKHINVNGFGASAIMAEAFASVPYAHQSPSLDIYSIPGKEFLFRAWIMLKLMLSKKKNAK